MAEKDIAELCHSLSLEDGDEPVTTLDSHLKEVGSKVLKGGPWSIDNALLVLEVPTGDGVEKIMPLKYERLPEYCFRCGLIGHPLHECMAQAAASLMVGEEKLRFGEWLRASSPPRLSSKISTSAEAIQSTKKTSSGGNDSAEINPPSAVTQTSTKQGEGAVAVEVIQADV
ncbi:hypothetical protein ACOSQ3_021812 [Xanthoceras sorbifolium]